MKNMRRNLVILMVSVSFVCQAQTVEKKMRQKEVSLLVDSVCAALKHWYVYPDKAALVSKSIKLNFKSGAYSKVNTRNELAVLLHNDIQQVHKDKHLRVKYDPSFADALTTVLPDSLEKIELENNKQRSREQNFYFIKTEILPGNIGYLRWDAFDGDTEEAFKTFNAAFQFVANTKALIIDMRYNGGGSPETVLAMQNYFFNEKVPMNHIIDWKNDTIKRYTDPGKTDFKLRMPVYVLTSKGTFSGAEDFTYGLKFAKRALVVGDTTGGGAHPTGPCCLGQGFVMHVPLARSYNESTKSDWEGTGITPDISIPSEKALAKANSIALGDIIAKTSDQREKNLLQFHLNGLRPKLMQKDSLKLSKEMIAIYCGDYTRQLGQTSIPLSITVNNDILYRHLFNGVEDARLIPVGDHKFIYDDDSGRIMEFKIDSKNNVSSLVLSTRDGVFTYVRNPS